MKFKGVVSSKTENTTGHSQVRISGEVLLSDGAQPQPVELIVSTPSLDVVDALRRGTAVEFDL